MAKGSIERGETEMMVLTYGLFVGVFYVLPGWLAYRGIRYKHQNEYRFINPDWEDVFFVLIPIFNITTVIVDFKYVLKSFGYHPKDFPSKFFRLDDVK